MSGSAAVAGVGLGAMLLAGVVGAAEERPLYLPSRDVAVTYVLDHQGPGPPKQARVYYSAASGKIRVEEPGQKQILIFDRPAKTTTVVLLREHVYIQTPLDPELAIGLLPDDDANFTRGVSETIAGRRCTDWEVDTAVVSGTVCLTDDGVLLRSRGQAKNGSGGGGLEAIAVSYAAQPASLFVPPPGFFKVDMSDFPGKLPK